MTRTLRNMRTAAIVHGLSLAVVALATIHAPAEAASSKGLVSVGPNFERTLALHAYVDTSPALQDRRGSVTLGDISGHARWELQDAGNGRWKIVDRFSGLCLDQVAPSDGAFVYLHPCHGGDNQIWRAVGGETFQLVNQLGGRCLDVADFHYTPGARLVAWPCTGNWNQRWLLR